MRKLLQQDLSFNNEFSWTAKKRSRHFENHFSAYLNVHFSQNSKETLALLTYYSIKKMKARFQIHIGHWILCILGSWLIQVSFGEQVRKSCFSFSLQLVICIESFMQSFPATQKLAKCVIASTIRFDFHFSTSYRSTPFDFTALNTIISESIPLQRC